MHDSWASLLSQFDLKQPTPKSTGQDFIYLLDHYRLLATQGPDAGKFLQGQASCDINKITEQQAQYGSLSSPKGRLYAHFLASKNSDDSYLLRLPLSIVENTQQNLAKYLAFFKAQQQDCSSDYCLFGLKGPSASANIANCFGSCPSTTLASLNGADYSVIAIDPEQGLYECWIKNSTLSLYWPQLSHGLSCAASEQWQLQLIRLGIAEVSAATADQYIAQMLNYQATGAISFKKGCFTGQEIVARMQYKGKLKRRLYRIELANSATLNPNDEVFSSEKNSAVGNLINIAPSGNNTQEALAVLNNDAALDASLYVKADETTVPVSLLDLPYNLN